MVFFSGPTVAANCDVIELVDAKRCITSIFYIVAKDQYGNRKTYGGDKIEIAVIESMLSVPSPLFSFLFFNIDSK